MLCDGGRSCQEQATKKPQVVYTRGRKFIQKDLGLDS